MCLPFGEMVLYLPAGAESRFEPQWRQGIWIGIATKNGENKLFDIAGGQYAQARSVKRLPHEDRDLTAFQGVGFDPWMDSGTRAVGMHLPGAARRPPSLPFFLQEKQCCA